MSTSKENEPTTFGVIIEKKSPLVATSSGTNAAPTTSASTTMPMAPLNAQQGSTTRPTLHHIAPASTPIQAPLPSPYSMSEQHDRASDLEDGHYQAPTVSNEHINAKAAHPLMEPKLATIVIRTSTPTRQQSSASTATSATAAPGVHDEKLMDVRVQDCTMWPSQVEMKARHKREKRARSKNPLMRLRKRNRVIVSVVIALAIVALAVGLGVGVSRAVHGGVWAGNGKTTPIPN
ncbi:hypothetical protein BT63DRAFT_215883 [Microthyrium microscopicum]|uniref:Uncharacterized protein n=1 Tax=Microthyrium microscopicum TaxID=703497 RepID=A0A6A6UK04_9PEZI|nr:hypothetical protein BT63DRAFT_215883 [Microthyrium microscopicum]